jgi:uncharacterized protein YfcZ (UPF0381/DUF406 family)
MTVQNDLLVYNSYDQTTNSQENDKIYLSQKLLDEAKEISSSSEYYGLVYNDKTVAINQSNIDTLTKLFGSDVVSYEDIYIATNDAEEYMKEVEEYVLNNIDTASESVSLSDSVNIEDVLSPELYSMLDIQSTSYEEESFISINDIINLHISFDTTDELSQSDEESAIDSYAENSTIPIATNSSSSTTSSTSSTTSSTTSSSSSSTQASGGAGGASGVTQSSSDTEAELEELYERLAELEKQISELTTKLKKAEDEEIERINQQIATLNAQVASINAEIQSFLEKESEG